MHGLAVDSQAVGDLLERAATGGEQCLDEVPDAVDVRFGPRVGERFEVLPGGLRLARMDGSPNSIGSGAHQLHQLGRAQGKQWQPVRAATGGKVCCIGPHMQEARP
ncbi:hypothetical protein [Streptomyces sp. NBC_01142]|uniref:hypothetical protein n=1 Tax=Streptomyces sp. NBC_01142 TaxID=2975865 RepID=UPI002251CEB8|nr:hypothetical protein [Streptomyces sp. NBC_01142]